MTALRDSAAESSLIVPVLDAEPRPRRLARRAGASRLLGLPAHITLLYPFVPPHAISHDDLSTLAQLFSGRHRVPFCLSDVGWFDERVLYLRPVPTDPFVALTQAIVEAFPRFPPYGGAFDEVLPHLTVVEGAPIERMRKAERRIRRKTPICGVATEVWLMASAPSGGRWSIVRSFPLREGPGASRGEPVQ